MNLLEREMIRRVLDREGGYVNHPKDPGGETNFGITKAVARAHGYTGSMRELPKSTAIEIYYKSYWLKNKCDMMPLGVAFQFFDACVNHGGANAAKMLQRAVGVTDDGIIGERTLRAIENEYENDIAIAFNAERLKFYANLKTFPTFGRGWVRRVADNLQCAIIDMD